MQIIVYYFLFSLLLSCCFLSWCYWQQVIYGAIKPHQMNVCKHDDLYCDVSEWQWEYAEWEYGKFSFNIIGIQDA